MLLENISFPQCKKYHEVKTHFPCPQFSLRARDCAGLYTENLIQYQILGQKVVVITFYPV